MCQSKWISRQAILVIFFLSAQLSFAGPVLHEVAHGQIVVQQGEQQTTVHQNSDKAILHWKAFNINHDEAVHFQQPLGGIALNRIDPSQGASMIDGKLTASGKIILLNGAGIHFGPRAYVNVGSIIASNLNLSNENFLASQYVFQQTSRQQASVTNRGHIKAADHGLVALIGPRIENHGLIEAKLGTIVLQAGNKVTLDFHGNDLIHFAVEEEVLHPNHPAIKRGVKNTGKIYADGGKILVPARSVSRVLDSVINMKGVAQVHSVEQRGGVIILHGAGSQGAKRRPQALDKNPAPAVVLGLVQASPGYHNIPGGARVPLEEPSAPPVLPYFVPPGYIGAPGGALVPAVDPSAPTWPPAGPQAASPTPLAALTPEETPTTTPSLPVELMKTPKEAEPSHFILPDFCLTSWQHAPGTEPLCLDQVLVKRIELPS